MTDRSALPGSCYTDRLGRTVSDNTDPWLERWKGVLESSGRGLLLELGCGGGRDTRFLTALGFDVTAVDNSPNALELCSNTAPLARVRLLDISEPLPFSDQAFTAVVASLCLHFFPWSITLKIMEEIRRCLAPGGILLLRVNSIRDFHHDAAGAEEVEPNFFVLKGMLKRFFDRDTMELLIATGWKLRSLEELQVDRYGSAKFLWEAVLEKS
jgi:SAM-dependent methyltransferase